tara:strand:- start:520 stop:765 length:246 start_codon:yes stop_codon:yes gene_type:complete
MKIKLGKFHRIKWLYDGCNSIDEMLERLSGETEILEDMQELGAKLQEASPDDYTQLAVSVEEGSEEYDKLVNLGFAVEDQE